MPSLCSSSWFTTSCPGRTAAGLASGQDGKAVTLRLCQGPEEAEQVQDLHLQMRVVELHGPQRSVTPRMCACHLKRTPGLPRFGNCGRRCLVGWLSASLRLVEGELPAERSQGKRCSLLVSYTRQPLCQHEPVPPTPIRLLLLEVPFKLDLFTGWKETGAGKENLYCNLREGGRTRWNRWLTETPTS